MVGTFVTAPKSFRRMTIATTAFARTVTTVTRTVVFISTFTNIGTPVRVRHPVLSVEGLVIRIRSQELRRRDGHGEGALVSSAAEYGDRSDVSINSFFVGNVAVNSRGVIVR